MDGFSSERKAVTCSNKRNIERGREWERGRERGGEVCVMVASSYHLWVGLFCLLFSWFYCVIIMIPYFINLVHFLAQSIVELWILNTCPVTTQSFTYIKILISITSHPP